MGPVLPGGVSEGPWEGKVWSVPSEDVSDVSLLGLRKRCRMGVNLKFFWTKSKTPVGERSVIVLLASEVPGAGRVPEAPGFSWSCVQLCYLVLEQFQVWS